MSKKELIELTDEVIKEVLRHEVIFPSTYQKIFKKVARERGIDVEDPELIKTYGSVELEQAQQMLEQNREDLDEILECNSEAIMALASSDAATLHAIEDRMQKVSREMNKRQDAHYKDELTTLFNRIWIQEKYLQEGVFVNEGHLVFLVFNGMDDILAKHGKVVHDKVIVYIATYLNRLYPEVELIKYSEKEFLYFIENKSRDELVKIFTLANKTLQDKKLKATNGELLHLSFTFSVINFASGDHFRDVMEIANSLLK